MSNTKSNSRSISGGSIDVANKYKKYQSKLDEAYGTGNRDKVELYSKKVRMYKTMMQNGGEIYPSVSEAQNTALDALKNIKTNIDQSGLTDSLNQVKNTFEKMSTNYKDTVNGSVEFGKNVTDVAKKINVNVDFTENETLKDLLSFTEDPFTIPVKSLVKSADEALQNVNEINSGIYDDLLGLSNNKAEFEKINSSGKYNELADSIEFVKGVQHILGNDFDDADEASVNALDAIKKMDKKGDSYRNIVVSKLKELPETQKERVDKWVGILNANTADGRYDL